MCWELAIDIFILVFIYISIVQKHTHTHTMISKENKNSILAIFWDKTKLFHWFLHINYYNGFDDGNGNNNISIEACRCLFFFLFLRRSSLFAFFAHHRLYENMRYTVIDMKR